MKAKPVILSGGSGVRLWPISRKNLAKQFVDIFQNESSLFLDTVRRVSGSLFDSPLIISNTSQRFEILKLIKKFKFKTNKKPLLPLIHGNNCAHKYANTIRNLA